MKEKGIAAITLLVGIIFIIILGSYLANKLSYKSNPQNDTISAITPAIIQSKLNSVTPTTYQSNIIDENTITENQTIFSLDDSGFAKLATISFTLGGHYGSSQPILGSSGNIYFTSKDKVFTYNLNTGKQIDIYKKNSNGLELTNLTLNQKKNLLYVSQLIEIGGKMNKFLLKEVDLSNSTEREIPQFPAVLYGNAEFLFSANGLDIVASFGGDGCGAYGKIYKIINSKAEEIINTGHGCVEDPRFIEANEDKSSVLLYSAIPQIDPLSTIGSYKDELNQLYWQNVITGEKQVLYDFKAENRTAGHFFINPEKTKMAYFIKNKIEIINIYSKEVEKEILLDITGEDENLWLGDKIYVVDVNNNMASIINVADGTVKEFNYRSMFGRDGIHFSIIGSKDDKAILFTRTN